MEHIENIVSVRKLNFGTFQAELNSMIYALLNHFLRNFGCHTIIEIIKSPVFMKSSWIHLFTEINLWAKLSGEIDYPEILRQGKNIF